MTAPSAKATAEAPVFEIRGGSFLRSFVVVTLRLFVFFCIFFAAHDNPLFKVFAAQVPGVVRAFPDLATYLWLSSGAVLLMACLAISVYDDNRHGRARFYEDRIEIQKYVLVFNPYGDPHVLPWSEVVAFDDASASFIKFVRAKRGWFDGVRLTVPTPGEKERLQLLAELERRGIRRV